MPTGHALIRLTGMPRVKSTWNNLGSDLKSRGDKGTVSIRVKPVKKESHEARSIPIQILPKKKKKSMYKCLTRSVIEGLCHVLAEIGYTSDIVDSTCYSLEIARRPLHRKNQIFS